MNQIPKVNLGIIIMREKEVLLKKENDLWSFPIYSVEKNETFEKCAYRENNEETGLKIKLITRTPTIWTNDIFEKEEKHYNTFFIKAKYISGEPKILEPKKCEEWKWFEWNNLPRNLFLPVDNLIKLGYNPFE